VSTVSFFRNELQLPLLARTRRRIRGRWVFFYHGRIRLSTITLVVNIIRALFGQGGVPQAAVAALINAFLLWFRRYSPDVLVLGVWDQKKSVRRWQGWLLLQVVR
jgi:hypothetical protein